MHLNLGRFVVIVLAVLVMAVDARPTVSSPTDVSVTAAVAEITPDAPAPIEQAESWHAEHSTSVDHDAVEAGVLVSGPLTIGGIGLAEAATSVGGDFVAGAQDRPPRMRLAAL